MSPPATGTDVTSTRSLRRKAAITAGWMVLAAASIFVVMLGSGDIHLTKSGPPSDHSEFVRSHVAAAACQAESYTLNTKTEPLQRRLIYSCVDGHGRWACFVEHGSITNVTTIVRVLFRGKPKGHRPRCTE